MTRRALIFTLVAAFSSSTPAPAEGAPPKCRGTKVLYKGKCLYPDEVRRLKAKRRRARKVPKTGVAPKLKRIVSKLQKWSRSDFEAIRDEGTMSQADDGNRNYQVKGKVGACGPNAGYEKIWHWRAMKGNWEYVCDVDFTDERQATAYYDAMSRVLRSIKDFDWGPEHRANDTTVRRLVGVRASPPLKIMFDFDREGGGVEIEFWFKKKNDPGTAPAANDPTDFAGIVSRLVDQARSGFRSIRGQRSHRTDERGNRYFAASGPNPCGSGKAEVVQVSGSWAWTCAFGPMDHRRAERTYAELATTLGGVRDLKWQPETWVDKITRKRTIGKRGDVSLLLDYVVSGDQQVVVRIWIAR